MGHLVVGKSTTALGVSYNLKLQGYKVENITEWIKEEIFAENFNICKDQIYIFAKQRRKQFNLQDKNLDFIVTDCPLPLSSFYGQKYGTSDDALDNLIYQEFNKFNNVNFFLKRTVPFETFGRIESEQDSDADSLTMLNTLTNKSVDYVEIDQAEKTEQILYNLKLSGYLIND